MEILTIGCGMVRWITHSLELSRCIKTATSKYSELV
jgi:hypothetical protein